MNRETMLTYDRLNELKLKYTESENTLRLLDALAELVEVDGLTLDDVRWIAERL